MLRNIIVDLARDRVLNHALCLCYALFRLSITAYRKEPHSPVSLFTNQDAGAVACGTPLVIEP